MTVRRTLYDARAAAAMLQASAGDLPGIDFMAGNIGDAAGDAKALAAFTETVRQQASQR